MDEIWVCHLGVTPYDEALALQQRLRAARQAELVPDILLLLEHPPVYTRGRRTAAGELPMGEAWYADRGIEIVDTDRGGRVTYHGPGQLVGYPIMRITDVIVYLRTMEDAIIAALAGENVPARVLDGLTGVWVADRKIASIGVHVSRGVTTHGFAVNVENDLRPFDWVVACGIQGVQMTSVERETNRLSAVPAERETDQLSVFPAERETHLRSLPCFRRRMAHQFALAHHARQRLVSLARLESMLAPVSGLA
ncbi:MAG TPA: lipoyl(octanoyl) transferase LipB [Solirubrobacteraceae bacterium]|jgi:lipoyl(octanoyl) transferase|nr:lipoyl(octanoyl) transferase LipB [Solirubrobacteraceae bacterium]